VRDASGRGGLLQDTDLGNDEEDGDVTGSPTNDVDPDGDVHDGGSRDCSRPRLRSVPKVEETEKDVNYIYWHFGGE